MLTLGLIMAIVVIAATYGLDAYNNFVKMLNKIDEAYATMDVYLKKRYDLIPNIVNTVKGYAAHESETLEKVIQARNQAQGAKTMDDRAEGEEAITGSLSRLFALSEAYPDLKANTNFIDLQKQLSDAQQQEKQQEENSQKKAEQRDAFSKKMDELESDDLKISSAENQEDELAMTASSFEQWVEA